MHYFDPLSEEIESRVLKVAVGIFKVLSYLTLVIPAAFAITFVLNVRASGFSGQNSLSRDRLSPPSPVEPRGGGQAGVQVLSEEKKHPEQALKHVKDVIAACRKRKELLENLPLAEQASIMEQLKTLSLAEVYTQKCLGASSNKRLEILKNVVKTFEHEELQKKTRDLRQMIFRYQNATIDISAVYSKYQACYDDLFFRSTVVRFTKGKSKERLSFDEAFKQATQQVAEGIEKLYQEQSKEAFIHELNDFCEQLEDIDDLEVERSSRSQHAKKQSRIPPEIKEVQECLAAFEQTLQHFEKEAVLPKDVYQEYSLFIAAPSLKRVIFQATQKILDKMSLDDDDLIEMAENIVKSVSKEQESMPCIQQLKQLLVRYETEDEKQICKQLFERLRSFTEEETFVSALGKLDEEVKKVFHDTPSSLEARWKFYQSLQKVAAVIREVLSLHVE